jgi:fluoroquinolone resistance protein
MADRRAGAPAPETETEIRNACWEGEDLTGQEHTAVAFVDVDFTDAITRGTTFTACAFRDSRFNGSRHTDSAFVNCTFTRCRFFDTEFSGCKLVGSLFDRCTFDLLDVRGGDWSFVGLPGADLQRAIFRDVRMRDADLTGARLEGARLRDVDLGGAWLHRTRLARADMRGSELSALDPREADVHGAIVDPDQTVAIALTLGFDVRIQEE